MRFPKIVERWSGGDPLFRWFFAGEAIVFGLNCLLAARILWELATIPISLAGAAMDFFVVLLWYAPAIVTAFLALMTGERRAWPTIAYQFVSIVFAIEGGICFGWFSLARHADVSLSLLGMISLFIATAVRFTGAIWCYRTSGLREQPLGIVIPATLIAAIVLTPFVLVQLAFYYGLAISI